MRKTKPRYQHFVSLIVPAYKQEKIIVRNLKQLQRALDGIRYDYEIIVVVDGKIDRTAEKIRRANLPKVVVIEYAENQGKSYAIRTGMKKATGDYVMFIDSGMEIDPNGISMLIEHMEWYSADVIVGSKRHLASKVRYSWQRRILSYGYYYFVRFFFGVKVHDTQAGIKIFRRPVLKKILPRLVEKRFAGDLEMLVAAKSMGYDRIYEAPIKLDYTFSKLTSAATWKSIMAIFIDTVAIMYRVKVIGQYDPRRSLADLKGIQPQLTKKLTPVKTKPLKIAIFNWRSPDNPKAGGAEQVTLEHAKAWVKAGHQVTWIGGRNTSSTDIFISRTSQDTPTIHYYLTGLSSTFFFRAWWIYWARFGGRFDIVIDEIHGIPSFAPLWAWKSKVIVLQHEVAKEIWNEMFSFPINQIGQWIESVLLPKVYQQTPFWVDAQSTKHDLIELGLPVKNISVIPCAIHPKPLAARSKQKKLTCIFLARLVPMKGIETALRAFQEIQKQSNGAQLWIVGDGHPSYVEQLKTQVKNWGMNNSVKFWGRVKEEKKYELLAKAHFLLHTSVREGFGLTVLEANSQKTPAAVFNVAGLRELVFHSKTGIVSPYPDIIDLAAQVVKVYRDKRRYRQMSQAAYQLQKKYRWPLFTVQSLELIKKLHRTSTKRKA